MNKFKLTIEYDYDFLLIGIACHEKDYRVVWSINTHLKTDLKKADDLKIEQKKKTPIQQFSFYEYIDEEFYREFFLIANRSEGGMLVPEQKQVDYFLMVKGSLKSEEKIMFMQQLKKINIVLAAYDINPANLLSKQNLLF